MGRSALAGVGSCLQKGPALSDIHQFVRIAQIKSLNSNCVLVLMFHLRSIKYFQPPAGGGASATKHGKLCSHHKTVIKKIIGGHVLEKVKDHLSNSNAQTRVGIVGQLAGLSFGPDEYLAKKNVYNECMNTSFSSNIDHF